MRKSGLVMLGLTGIGLAVVAGAVHAAAPASAEWAQWRGPNRDGKSPDTGLLKEWPADGPTLLWKVGDIGHGFSSVAVSGGTIYITGEVGGKLMLFAFDLEGKGKWRVPADDAYSGDHAGTRATPTIDEGRLYLLSGRGTIGCLDARTGQPVWRRHTREFGGKAGSWGYAESILILQPEVIKFRKKRSKNLKAFWAEMHGSRTM